MTISPPYFGASADGGMVVTTGVAGAVVDGFVVVGWLDEEVAGADWAHAEIAKAKTRKSDDAKTNLVRFKNNPPKSQR